MAHRARQNRKSGDGANDDADVAAAETAHGASDVLASFDIHAPELPQAIADAALRSGGFPYDDKLSSKVYRRELRGLQIELLKLATWVRQSGERLVVVFEGRDGAGKGGAITRFTQHLNPRSVRIVALPRPSNVEAGQWYFQRYVSELPSAGEIVLFDRSWYNRAGVEPVMGFCSPEQTERFLNEAPVLEKLWTNDGIRLIKILLTIGPEMQMARLHAREHDPLKHWKLSPIDYEAIPRFDAYSRAFDRMIEHTSTPHAPWTVIRGNDKLRARLAVIRHVLTATPYTDRDDSVIGKEDRGVVLSAKRFLCKGGEPTANGD
ncbi:polyphosphate kinase 2 [Pseudochelatococcus lubricantis]|uniref:ADP/GDP-polyphosphate phosphotransferase n=1 Tax=Pseudochelatococcus lubricantis TaxID=1538102 RepID=A0ABX0V4X0_9HYPH|nr:polyphosphate kinase 2 [Pseudochelatococcus lubricantis]NIJ58146.1 polyphosphate kinase 2 [Pseudochelatococcus lubricantis]